jgi:hypothetical protein
VFAVADELRIRGWYVDRQSPPDSLHCTVNAIHHDKIDEFIADLDTSINVVLHTHLSGVIGSYGNLE